MILTSLLGLTLNPQTYTLLGILAAGSIPASAKIVTTYLERRGKNVDAKAASDLASADLKKVQAADLITETAKKVVELTQDTFDGLRKQVSSLEDTLRQETTRCDLLQATITSQQVVLTNQARQIADQAQKIKDLEAKVDMYHAKGGIIAPTDSVTTTTVTTTSPGSAS